MPPTSPYTELHLHTHYSFLDGASSPEALVRRAAELGMPALAVTDHQGLYGAVKFAMACREHGVRPIFGAEVTVADAGHLTLLVESPDGWANLCEMLSEAGLAGTKRDRPVSWEQVERFSGGLICLTGCREGVLAAPAARGDRAVTLANARRLRDIFGADRCYVELQRHLDRGDRRREATLVALAEHIGLAVVATNNVHYATPDGFRLQHVLACIRHRVSLDAAGQALYATPHRYLKSGAEIAALFADRPEAIANTARIAERCRFTLDLAHARLPAFPVPAGETAFSHLYALCYDGLRRRFNPVTPQAAAQLAHELGVIERTGLAEYFLIVHDLVAFARAQGILCQGRGSAAGSIAAYTLGITPVDPLAHGLLFERFLAEDSTATPDIDIDFAADRREEVIQYVYRRYGADRTAMVANVLTFQARSAVADVGMALGFPRELLARVRDALYTRSADKIAPDLAEVDGFARDLHHLPWRLLVDLCARIDGCPRHLGIHSGGMIVTAQPLARLVPLERATMPGRVVVQWDKDDVADAGLIKIDLLGLRTLSLVTECFAHIEAAGGPALAVETVPAGDPEVWAMLGTGDSLGCFQVESRAQMNLLPRMRPTRMNDLVVEVALIRPGPVQGGMAKTYMARRDGDEPVSYWHPLLEPVLAETLGIMVFQEQVLRVSMVLAGFSGAQADGLRRAMSRKRSRDAMEHWRADFLTGAADRGVDRTLADGVFDHLLGFASYGFCKSHAAAFAQLSYVTSWLKCYWPLPFYCGLLNAQPMGFYSTEAVIEDAKRHAVTIYPLDINCSGARWAIEGRGERSILDNPSARSTEAQQDGPGEQDRNDTRGEPGLRVPLTRLSGLGSDLAEAIVAARQAGGDFTDLWDFVRRTRTPRAIAERLVRAGAVSGVEDRRQQLWALGEMHWVGESLDLPPAVTPARLPDTTVADTVAADYTLLGLAQTAHLLALYRPQLAAEGVITSLELSHVPEGVRVSVAGRIEVVQRPPTAKGLAFMSLEDEHGLINLILYPETYTRNRRTLRGSPILIAEGLVQRDRGAMHVIVERVRGMGGEA